MKTIRSRFAYAHVWTSPLKLNSLQKWRRTYFYCVESSEWMQTKFVVCRTLSAVLYWNAICIFYWIVFGWSPTFFKDFVPFKGKTVAFISNKSSESIFHLLCLTILPLWLTLKKRAEKHSMNTWNTFTMWILPKFTLFI